jgi:prepilin-type N-terminal cleavage/methylation domain-containing protein
MVLSLKLRKSVRGFTLIELMVALTIMAVSTGLLLANYPNSIIKLTLLNNTHSSALLVREAQIRGSAIDSASTTVGGYGVFVDKTYPSKAILFSDNVEGVDVTNNAGFHIGDGLYNDVVSPDVAKDTLQFKEGYYFKKLCVASSTAAEYLLNPQPFLCNTVNGTAINTMTISFNRPSQVAHIYINGNNSNDFTSACLQLYSPKSPEVGHVRALQILHSGVITTKVTSCD